MRNRLRINGSTRRLGPPEITGRAKEGPNDRFIAAIATVATLIDLAIRIRTSNRLARAEASRAPNSDLNSINSAFGTDPTFRAALRRVLKGATREELDPDQRIILDFHMVSITNIQDQLSREIRAGILDPDALDFGGAGLFSLPYDKSSWPLDRGFLSFSFVSEFEIKDDLDPPIRAEW